MVLSLPSTALYKILISGSRPLLHQFRNPWYKRLPCSRRTRRTFQMKSPPRASGACLRASWVAHRSHPNRKLLPRTRKMLRQQHLRRPPLRRLLLRSQRLRRHLPHLLHIVPTASAFLLNGSTNALVPIRTCVSSHHGYHCRRRSCFNKRAYTLMQSAASNPQARPRPPAATLAVRSQSGHSSPTSARTSSTEERTRVYRQISKLKRQRSASKPSDAQASLVRELSSSASLSAGTISSHLSRSIGSA